MKKIITIVIGLIMFSMLLADVELILPEGLEFNENNEVNLIGEDFNDVGEYEYLTDWMSIVNVGSEVADIEFNYFWEGLPTGWTCSVCDEESCYMPHFPTAITLDPGAERLIHLEIGVHSAASFQVFFEITENEVTTTYTFNFYSDGTDNCNDSNELAFASVFAYPNPFNPQTSISFNIVNDDNVKISVFNLKGRYIETIADESFQAGTHSFLWNASKLPSGIYFYQVETSYSKIVKKLTLLK